LKVKACRWGDDLFEFMNFAALRISDEFLTNFLSWQFASFMPPLGQALMIKSINHLNDHRSVPHKVGLSKIMGTIQNSQAAMVHVFVEALQEVSDLWRFCDGMLAARIAFDFVCGY